MPPLRVRYATTPLSDAFRPRRTCTDRREVSNRRSMSRRISSRFFSNASRVVMAGWAKDAGAAVATINSHARTQRAVDDRRRATGAIGCSAVSIDSLVYGTPAPLARVILREDPLAGPCPRETDMVP